MNDRLLGVDFGSCSHLGVFGGLFETAAAARDSYRETGLRFDHRRDESAEPFSMEAGIWLEICEYQTLRPDPVKYPVNCEQRPQVEFLP